MSQKNEGARPVGREVKDEEPGIDSTPSEAVSPDLMIEVINRLASLQPLDYEVMRTAEAKRLGVRISALDEAVMQTRKDHLANSGKPTMFPLVEPWPVSVEPADLLDQIHRTVRRFIICDTSTSIAAALWIAFTWFIDHVMVAPLAVITAPEKRCGKSQLLDVICRLSRRPIVASNISPAAVYRTIEAFKPTLLIDEADSFLKDNEELRGVINSGHTRQSAYVIRTVGDDHEPRQFSTWGAKAIAGIGHLSGTLMDRAVVLTLRRKLSNEKVERLRHADPSEFACLASKLARFAEDNGQAIADARPDLPEALNDRAQDNWEPLLAIADLAGGEWPKNARAAALNISGAEHDTPSTSAELLADVREAFGCKGLERMGDRLISTADLLKCLLEDELKPWSSYYQGRQMNPRQLANRLKEYEIHSENIKFSYGQTLKGYRQSQFEDVFARYLTPSDTPSPNPLPATFGSPCGFEGSGEVEVADDGLLFPDEVAERDATNYRSATRKIPPLLQSSGVADVDRSFEKESPQAGFDYHVGEIA
ncbi:MAG: DUF3631 domain-containing protein [Holophaga sp.]|nr:DUF3631 domain-containing protein [Holophaga sp.]